MSGSFPNPTHDDFDWYGADYEPIHGRSLSLSDSAKHLGISPAYLRKILKAEDIYSESKRKGRPIYLSEDILSSLREKIECSIHLSALPRLLGIGLRPTRQLVDSGALPTWVSGGRQGPVHRYRFLKPAVEDWMASMTKTDEFVSEVPAGFVTIAKAIRLHLPVNSIVDALKAEKLAVVAVLYRQKCFGNFIISRSDIAAFRPPELRVALSAGASKRQGSARGHHISFTYADRGLLKRGGPPRPPTSVIIQHLENVDLLCAEGKQVKEAIAQSGLSITRYYRWRREFGRSS